MDSSCPRSAGRGALSARSPESDTLNCFSVDVEEHFHAEVFARCCPPESWAGRALRAAPFVERIAERLAETGNRATFFVLGWLAPHIAPLLRDLAAAGHEIACHGQNHQHLSRMTPATLRDDLRRARDTLAEITGVAPRGYRAPTFSVTRRTAWALDEIIAAGFTYDSSVFPVRHDRYGIPDAPWRPFEIVAPSGAWVAELPPLTLALPGLRLPMGGGGYLRLLPGWALRSAVAWRQRRREPAMVYIHPWELDPDQPRLPVGRLATWRHRVNLHATDGKLARLLQSQRFDTAERVLQRWRQRAVLPRFILAENSPSSSMEDRRPTTARL